MSTGDDSDAVSSGEPTAPSERQLLLRHRGGDGEAFAHLMAEYRSPVYSYLCRSGVGEADRDDLFQDIFLRIHRAAERYQDDRPLHPWLFTIVANTVRNHLRRMRVRELVGTEGTTPETADPAPDAERTASGRETARWLELEIKGLPEKQRQVLLLAAVEGLPMKVIASALAIPVNTVKTCLRRARLTLSERLVRRVRDETT